MLLWMESTKLGRGMEKISRYVVTSQATYRDSSGIMLRFLYATRTAHLMAVDLATAHAIDNGDVDALDQSRLAELREARAVVPADADERTMVLNRNRAAAGDHSKVHISLLPTSYCNMGCSYCGQEHAKGGLSADHRDRVRQRVLGAIAAPTTTHARIDWYGAEPLMGYAIIKDLAPQFVAAAQKLGVIYSSYLVTNGSLLSSRKIRTLIQECGVTNLEVTIDGPPDIHDVHRPLKSGQGSFWSIVRTVRDAVDEPDYARTTFSFRTNVDTHNLTAIRDYIELMGELGFDRPNVRFSIVPVHSWGNDVTEIEVNYREFAAREVDWLELLERKGLATALLPTEPARVVCPAVITSSEIISSTGNIFSCTELPLVPASERDQALALIADLEIGEHRPLGPFDSWNDDIETGRFGCSACVFMPTCGGSCPKAWHEGHPPCPSYKFNIQDRFDLIARKCGLAVISDSAIAS
jgi:uncharacterized protein